MFDFPTVMLFISLKHICLFGSLDVQHVSNSTFSKCSTEL